MNISLDSAGYLTEIHTGYSSVGKVVSLENDLKPIYLAFVEKNKTILGMPDIHSYKLSRPNLLVKKLFPRRI